MGSRSRRAATIGAAVLASLAWLVIAVAVEYMHKLEQAYQLEQTRAEVLVRASARRARLESELNATLFVANGTAGFISAYDDLLEPSRVATALELIYQGGRHLRNVALAPDNVIRYIHPLAGNESALGLDYADNPEQWPAVQRAIAEKSTIIDGPLELVQGGRGLLARTPIFLENGGYWGMLSLVIDIDSLFAVAGVGDPQAPVRYAVRRLQTASERRSVVGEQEIFDDDPVLLEISIPGARWQLGAVPRQGWIPDNPMRGIYRLAGHVAGLLIGVLLFIILRERAAARWLALHDPLTRLPNRRQLRRRLERDLRRAGRVEDRLALLYIDLNGFKAINDRHGHGKGDEVLAAVADRLRSALGREAFLARIGGDEFIAVMPPVVDPGPAIQAMRAAVRRPLDGVAGDLSLDAAVGVAWYPDDGTELTELLHAADQRMYMNKKPQR